MVSCLSNPLCAQYMIEFLLSAFSQFQKVESFNTITKSLPSQNVLNDIKKRPNGYSAIERGGNLANR